MKALYYNANLEPKPFDVLRKNADGTVDLGAGKVLAVGKCVVVEAPAAGCATLGDKVPEVAPAPAEPDPAPETINTETR